jgi:hypothetical protein
MLTGILVTAAAILSVSGVAIHDPQFHPYKAPLPAFSGGEGGKHASALGIEVWSQGAPTRPFQILGTLIDNRAIGSYLGPTNSGFVKIIAKGTRGAGGDAAILDGAVPDNQRSYATLASRNIRDFLNGSAPPAGQPSYVTRFWVVKYLTPASAATPEPALR